MISPYILPLFILAVILCTFKSQWQALIVMMVAPHVYDSGTLLFVVVFASASHLLGRMLSAANSV